jgi:hypothetical protein
LSFPVYFDEHVQAELAAMLVGRGFDVLTARDVGRSNRGLSDEDQLAYATAESRVLVTYDLRDYFRIAREWEASGRSHAGIVVSSQRPPEEQVPRFLKLFELYADGFPPNLSMQLPIAD